MGKSASVVLVGFVLALAGCGGGSGGESSQPSQGDPAGGVGNAVESVGESQSQLQKSSCECQGLWYCSSDGAEYWYEQLYCGWPNYSQARSMCTAHCYYQGGTCINAGWQC